MGESWPVVADTEAADLQEFVSEYKHFLRREALWKVAELVAEEAGVELQRLDSPEDEAQTEDGPSASGGAGRSPGKFVGRLVPRPDFDDPLPEDMSVSSDGE